MQATPRATPPPLPTLATTHHVPALQPAAAAAHSHPPALHLAVEPRVARPASIAMPKPYILGWIGLAFVSLAYLAALSVRPDLVAEYLPLVADSSRAGTPDAVTLRQTIAELRNEIAGLKAEVLEHQERNAELMARLASLEPKAAERQVAEAKPAEPVPPSAATALARKFADPRGPEAGKAPDAKAAEVKPIEPKRVAVVTPPAAKTPPHAAEKAATPVAIPPAAAAPDAFTPLERQVMEGIETGSIAPDKSGAPVAFGPAVVTPAPKPIGIQIASGSSVEALRLSWSLLSDHHADSLKNLQPRVIGGAEGTGYDLVAGPLKSQAEAKKVCKALQSKNITCRIGSFEGDAL